MCSLLNEGFDSERFVVGNLDEITTKSIYMTFAEDLPPPRIQNKYLDRDWNKVWARLNSGVLHPFSREVLFFMIHERTFTRERAHRILNVIETPFCDKCGSDIVESVIHRFSTCSRVHSTWLSLRSTLETLDSSLCQESEDSILHLYYEESLASNSILWLIGEYVVFIENEVVLSNRNVSSQSLSNHLRSRWIECSKLNIPNLEFILGLLPTGVG